VGLVVEGAVSVVVEAVLAAAALLEDGKMTSRAAQFLSPEEQKRVTEAVQQAEKMTSGEIVPMIVAESDDYPNAAMIFGLSCAFPLAICLTYLVGPLLWIGSQNIWLFLLFTICLYPIFSLLAKRSDWARRPFFNSRRVEKEVAEGALAAFFSEGLYRTKDANGILLYISVLEQRVWILADRAINEKIDEPTWNSLVDELTSSIKSGQRAAGICNAVEKIGQILRVHFPYQKDDTDEQHNLIIR
jgi:putative membrane protein